METSKSETREAKFPSRPEIKRFLDELEEIGIPARNIYDTLEIYLKHFHDGRSALNYRFYLDWSDVFPNTPDGSGPWLSDNCKSLEELYEAIVVLKGELEEGLCPTEVKGDKG